MFPARNNEIALYNKSLNNTVDKCFSVNANMVNAEKPMATKVKYNFFRLFIRSLGLMNAS
jgi:hypothetical protein